MNDTNQAAPLNTSSVRQGSERRLPRSTYLLLMGQGINLTAAVVSVAVAALVGAKLAPSATLGTVPYGAQFGAVMLATYPAASFMHRFGRRLGFSVGALSLIGAGFVGYEAVVRGNFWLLIVAHVFLGTYIGFANYYRFAAVDNIGETLRSQAMSLVVSGGVIAAFVGPILAVGLRDVAGFPPFSLSYAAFSLLGLLSLLLMAFWKGESVRVRTGCADARGRAIARDVPLDATRDRQALIMAMGSAAAGYFLMNMLMVQALLAMNHMGVSYRSSSLALQAHVLAMFAPSFITGLLISRVGTSRVIVIGFGLLASAALFGLLPAGFESMTIGFVLLGLGWNLTYVGGGVLLSQKLSFGARHKWQGINDSAVAISATVGATIPSLLQTTVGWAGSNLGALLASLAGLFVCMRFLPKDTHNAA